MNSSHPLGHLEEHTMTANMAASLLTQFCYFIFSQSRNTFTTGRCSCLTTVIRSRHFSMFPISSHLPRLEQSWWNSSFRILASKLEPQHLLELGWIRLRLPRKCLFLYPTEKQTFQVIMFLAISGAFSGLSYLLRCNRIWQKPDNPISRTCVAHLLSNLNSIHSTSALSILILRMDLRFMKIPPPYLWSKKGVMCSGLPEDTFSLDHLETHSNRNCASMQSSSTIFQNWSYTTAHSGIYILLWPRAKPLILDM